MLSIFSLLNLTKSQCFRPTERLVIQRAGGMGNRAPIHSQAILAENVWDVFHDSPNLPLKNSKSWLGQSRFPIKNINENRDRTREITGSRIRASGE